jgi:hypothetical protein
MNLQPTSLLQALTVSYRVPLFRIAIVHQLYPARLLCIPTFRIHGIFHYLPRGGLTNIDLSLLVFCLIALL